MTTDSRSRRTWFITGATSGIGRALTELALRNGDNVAGIARITGGLEDLAAVYPDTLAMIGTDVRHELSVNMAVRTALDAFGRIDVVANNAGYGLFGAVEETTDAQARAIFDTNVFGVLNVLRATLPALRAQRSGHILQGSSFYGQSAHPGVGLLAATKYAVEGLSDALVAEVEPLGITVTLVQPGPTATAFVSNLDPAEQIDDYDRTVRQVQKAISERQASALCRPESIAEALFEVVDSGKAPLRLALGM